MSFEISHAAPSDLPAIAAIWNKVIRESSATFTDEEKTLEGLREWLAQREAASEAVLVARDGPDCIAFAAYFPFRGGRGYRFTKELTIYVAEGQQGSGLGTTLLKSLEVDAKSKGIHSLWAGCSATNPGSIRFHARQGYAEIARLPAVGYKFGKWIDLILMQKRL